MPRGEKRADALAKESAASRVLSIVLFVTGVFIFLTLQAPRGLAQEPPQVPTNVQMHLGNQADCLRRTLDLEYCADVFAALKDIEAYWESHFVDISGGLRSYSGPESFRFYYPADSFEDVDCTDPETTWTSCTPAFYEYSQRAIVINEPLLQQFHKRGDFSAITVLAHEWGHHIQNLLGRQPTAGLSGESGYVIQDELQADCYAGMWSGTESRIGGRLEPGDLQEALQASFAGGDPKSTKWTAASAHGQPLQRVLAFRTGYDELAADGCRAWQSYKGEPVINLGDYSLALSPKMTAYQSPMGDWVVLRGSLNGRVSVLPRLDVLGLLDEPDSLKDALLGPGVVTQVDEPASELPAAVSASFDAGIYAARELRFEARQDGRVESGVLYVYLPSGANSLAIDIRSSGAARSANWAELEATLAFLLLGLQVH